MGIIPARAGFTGGRRRESLNAWDHPRSRGVYGKAAAAEEKRAGSSPLARGLPPGMRLSANRVRIIPARAGFTGALPQARGRIRDHPRSRGVYRIPVTPRL